MIQSKAPKQEFSVVRNTPVDLFSIRKSNASNQKYLLPCILLMTIIMK